MVTTNTESPNKIAHRFQLFVNGKALSLWLSVFYHEPVGMFNIYNWYNAK